MAHIGQTPSRPGALGTETTGKNTPVTSPLEPIRPLRQWQLKIRSQAGNRDSQGHRYTGTRSVPHP